ncbi:MAG: PQQ-binding-like beta-propeller repeat protein, partial [Thermoplasmata archaeon]
MPASLPRIRRPCHSRAETLPRSPRGRTGRRIWGASRGTPRIPGRSSDAASLTQLWSFPTGVMNPGYLQAEPVEVDNTIYVGAGSGFFYALNTTTGAEVWESPNLGTNLRCNYPDGVTSSATVEGGDVYVGGGDGYFYALDQATGAVDWQFFVGDPTQGFYNWASPLVLPSLGHVYIGVSSGCDNPLVDGGLDQVSLTTHQLVHFFSDLSIAQQANCNPTKGPPFVENSSSDCGGSIWGSPSYDAATNTIWAATGNGYDLSVPEYGDSLMEWNASTLALIKFWTIPNAQEISDGDFGATPTLVDPPGGPPMVFVTDKNGWSYAFDRSDIGKGPVWQYKV